LTQEVLSSLLLDAYIVTSTSELEAVEPCYLTVNFSVDNPPYRYFKVEFNSVFKEIPNQYYKNTTERVTLHEVEVYVPA